jgi:thioredoxin
MNILTCRHCGARNRVDEEQASKKRPLCGRCGQPLDSAAADGHPLTITDANFQDVVLASSRPVLVDFWAQWCPPCRAIAPFIDQLAAESGGNYVVGKLNVDENPQTAGGFDISGIPTLLIFKNGQVVDRIVGAHPKQVLASRLAAHA